MEVVTTRFGDATKLGPSLKRGGANVASGEEVGDLKARIEEMKRSMALDAARRMRGEKGGDDVGSDFGGFDDLEETKTRFRALRAFTCVLVI